MKALRKNLNRIVSMVCILSMLFGVLMPLTNRGVVAEEITYAHTINLFSIDLTDGATYHKTYDGLDGENHYVWQADSSTEGHKFVYNIRFSLSGIASNLTEFVRFRIPAHILRDKAGNFADELELPVSSFEEVKKYRKKDPVTGEYIYVSKYDFVYRTINKPGTDEVEYYEIFNIFPISAGQVYEFPIAYMTTKPTWDYQDIAKSDDCQVTAFVNSWPATGNPSDAANTDDLVVESNKIPVHIDTSVNLKSTSKKSESGLLTAEKAEKLAGVSGLDEDYRYIWWSVTSEINDVTQKYNFKLTDTPGTISGKDGDDIEHSVQGEVVLIKMSGKTEPYYASGTGEFSAQVDGLSATGKRVDYVLLRYPYEATEGEGIKDLEEAAKDAEYIAKNDTTATLIPADGIDPKQELVDDAYAKWENKNPKWEGVGTKYGMQKYGLYNNGKNRVTNKSNVSSYSLEQLTKGEEVSGLKYEISASAYAYGKTISDLANEINSMEFPKNPGEITTVITAGSREYVFTNGNVSEFTVKKYSDLARTSLVSTDEKSVPAELAEALDLASQTTLTVLDMQRIAAYDIEQDYYGQVALKYDLTDDTFTLIPDLSAKTEESVALNQNDYRIDYVEFSYAMKNYTYDVENMSYSEGEKNKNYDESNLDAANILSLFVKRNGADDYEPTPVATINVRTGEFTITDSTAVDYISDGRIKFKSEAEITGYKFEITNKYFYNEIHAFPSITLKAGDESKVKQRADELFPSTPANENVEKKIGIKNTASMQVYHINTVTENRSASGTDYVAGIVRKSSISKQAMGERFPYTGQDGNEYRSANDTYLGQYRLRWQVKVAETANGMVPEGSTTPQNNVPVPQQSGIFYDLLPAHCDIIEGSVNVYADLDGDANTGSTALSPASFEVLDRIDDYNGSGQKLLIIKINSPCSKSYTVNYVTVHAHEDIQDFGSMALNSVAYQTGNEDIGDGYPDNGGNYELTMHEYIRDLDPNNNGAKRFIYAQALKDILALFPKSSGIYKKVATKSDPSYARTGVVHPGEIYTYNIRMKNDSVTMATDIAILDSIENYRKIGDEKFNTGLFEREWAGKLVGFDLSGILVRMEEYDANHAEKSVPDLKVIVYEGDGEDDIVNLEGQLYSDADARKYLLCTIMGQYDDANDAIRSALSKEAKADKEFPEEGTDEQKDAFISQYILDNFAKTKNQYDTEYSTELSKWKVLEDYNDISVDKDGQSIDTERISAFIVYTGKQFTLPKDESISFNVKMQAPDNVAQTKEADPDNGIFIYKPKTYNNVYRSFKNARQEDPSETPVETYFYTHYDYTELEYCVTGTVQFMKADYESGEGVSGVQFSLSGVSDYGTIYNETLTSDNQGYVVFKNLERGTYQLVESINDPDHVLDTTPRKVKIDPQGVFTFVDIGDDHYVYNENEGYADEESEYVFLNLPRAHGNFDFDKVNSLTGQGIAGAKFRLEGYSDYGTRVDLTVESDTNGKVDFGDLEKGTYTLKEVTTADGYMPLGNATFTVSGSGERDVIFSISGGDPGVLVENSSEYTINNEPLADMTLQKNDAITKAFLSGAKFVLTADSSLNAQIEALYSKIEEQLINEMSNNPDYDGYSGEELANLAEDAAKQRLHWEKSGDNYVQIVNGGNINNSRDYLFEYMPEGTYTLVEEIVPERYELPDELTAYTLTVAKDSSNHRYVITFSPEKSSSDAPYMQYMKFENGDYITTVKEEAECYRILNFEEYKEGKTVIKSWVGSVQNAPLFPVIHLSNEKPEEKVKTVTIGTALKDLVLTSSNKSNMKAFEKADSLPSEITVDSIPAAYMDNDEGETGHFYAWLDSSDNKVKWWSDADLIYLPRSCYELFKGSNDPNFTTFDLSYNTTGVQFSAEKTTTMFEMFRGCDKLTVVDLSCVEDTPLLETTRQMFQGCSNVTSIDLTNWRNAANLINMHSMYNSCVKLTKVEFPNLVIDGLQSTKQMFWNCYKLESVVFGNHITLYPYRVKPDVAPNDQWNVADGLTSMFSSAGKNTTGMIIDLSGLDTRQIRNDSGGNPWGLGHMFNNCSKLTTVYVSEYWDNTNFSTANADWGQKNIFNGCSSMLVGGEGTTWNGSHNADNSYARVDGGSSAPGYFTYKAAPSSSSGSGGSSSGSEGSAEKYNDYTLVSSTTPEVAPDGSEVGKSFTFEYVTAETGTQKGETYVVDEDIYLFVTDIYVDSGDNKTYKVTHKFKYDEPVTAVWTQVTNTFPSQWHCELMVHDSDDEFFVWEDEVTGFESTADRSTAHPAIKTSGSDEVPPVITNTGGDAEVGGIVLKKVLSSTDTVKYENDEFWFRVEMWKNDTKSEHYTLLPFGDGTGDTEAGVAYFKVVANDPDGVIISGIPENYYYEINEVEMSDAVHVQPAGYSFVSLKKDGASVPADSNGKYIASGEIEADKNVTVQAENTIVRTHLKVSKNANAFITYEGTSGVENPLTNPEDEDYIDWTGKLFAFTVKFENLEKGKEYTYTEHVGTETPVEKHFTASSTSSVTSVDIWVKDGMYVEFNDIPVDTQYTVTEVTSFENSESELGTKTYKTTYEVSNGNTVAETEGKTVPSGTDWLTLGSDTDNVTFTNEIHITRPETVSVRVDKQWKDKDNTTITFTLDNDDKVHAYAGSTEIENLSFIRVILGRTLVYQPLNATAPLYLDTTTSYIEYDINVKSILLGMRTNEVPNPSIDTWSYEFTNLEKYGEAIVRVNGVNVTQTLPYVYFVSEVCPLGYSNITTDNTLINISDSTFLEATSVGGSTEKYECVLVNKQNQTYNLSVTKLVSGNMADMTKQFAFDITMRDASGKLINGTVPVTYKDEINGAVRSRTATIISGKLSVTLPHGKTVTISNLPAGTSYVITEKASGLGGAVIKSGNIPVDSSPFEINVDSYVTEGSVQNGTLTDSNKAYLFVNTIDGKIPTGIDLSFRLPVLFGSALALAVAYFVIRRKKDDEDCEA